MTEAEVQSLLPNTSPYVNDTAGGDGLSNTGGGGGGSCSHTAGNGGSGVVIINIL